MILTKDDLVALYRVCRENYLARRRRGSLKMETPPSYYPDRQRRTCNKCNIIHGQKEMHARKILGHVKWFCDDCWQKMKRPAPKQNGRPKGIVQHTSCSACGKSSNAKDMRRIDYKWYCLDCFDVLDGRPQAPKKLMRRTCTICGEIHERNAMHRHARSSKMYCEKCWEAEKRC